MHRVKTKGIKCGNLYSAFKGLVIPLGSENVMEWVASADVGMVMGQAPQASSCFKIYLPKMPQDCRLRLRLRFFAGKTRMAKTASDYLVLKRGYDLP